MENESGPKNELDARLYRYAVDVVRFCRALPKDSATQVLMKQLIRSGTSVSANVVEAKGASSKKDYINFYSYALKSANESEFWIKLLLDTSELDKQKADSLLAETGEIAKILGASIITMKKNS